jgi:hypothetical protein
MEQAVQTDSQISLIDKMVQTDLNVTLMDKMVQTDSNVIMNTINNSTLFHDYVTRSEQLADFVGL